MGLGAGGGGGGGGVNVSIKVASHIGLELMHDVTVLYSSSVNILSFTILFKADVTLLTITSISPLWWLDNGVLKIQLIDLPEQNSVNFDRTFVDLIYNWAIASP